MKKKITIGLYLLALFFSSTLLPAQGYFEYSPIAVKTYDLIFSLRFQEARSQLVTLRITEPDNLIAYSLANYMDCLSIFIGEQVDTYEKLKQNKELR